MNKQYIDWADKLLKDTLSKYHKFGGTYVLDWEVFEYKVPRYDKPAQMLLPQVLVTFQ